MRKLAIPVVVLILSACFDKPDTGPGEESWEGQVAGECGDGADNDGDGYWDCDDDDCENAPECQEETDDDGDGYPDDLDCDDGDPDINPDADEVCDGVDNDCDGDIDEDDAVDAATWYADADADGYGDTSNTTNACVAPSGHTDDDTDCDDNDASIHPGADEHCDGVDNDCDDQTDEDAVDAGTWYPDADGDGYGDGSNDGITNCEHPSGYIEDYSDCDDTDADVYPGADEYCNGVDDDCDGTVDDDPIADATWYFDSDGDGYGDAATTTTGCEAPTGYVDDDTDCDDGDASVHPGADEWCDDVDSDCDGTVDDDDALDASSWYLDSDSDGYGDASTSTTACTQPTGHVSDDTDCDDSDDSINPGADELCDGLDNNCSGTVDDVSTGLDTYYLDADGDGYGDASSSTTDCAQPTGYVGDDTDCDDTDATINPAATEDTSDGVDNDCDGDVDEGSAVVCGDGSASYTSIQDAIDVASDGDVITICTGAYEEALTVSGLAVTLEGLGGADTVFIDGDTSPAITVESGADLDVIGVTLTGYNNTSVNGAALDCASSTVTMTDVVVTGSTNDYYGSGICFDACTATINGMAFEYNDVRWWIYHKNGGDLELTESVFHSNTIPAAASAGGFIATSNSDAEIRNNLMIDNVSDLNGQGAINISGSTGNVWFYNNTIASNEDNGSGTNSLIDAYVPSAVIENNIIAENTDYEYGISAYYGPTVEYNDAFGNSSGNYYCYGCTASSTNIEAAPRFTDDANWDYSLVTGFSPCIDTGNPLSGYNDGDGTRNDMGAFGGAGSAWDPPLYVYWIDADGDGYGDASASTRGSRASSGYVASGGDCDDTDATVHPGAAEVKDGLDNECDGAVDDICSCDVCDDGGSPYTSVQDAIDDASSGDTITICGGTWYENLEITGIELAILGTGADDTVINGGRSTALTVDTATVEIADVTLTGTGASTSVGAAITCADSDLTLTDVDIVDTTVSGSGYSMRFDPCDVVAEGLTVADNRANVILYLVSGSLELSQSIFEGNAGLLLYALGDSIVNNNLIYGNSSTGDAVFFNGSTGATHWLYNNTISDNTGVTGNSVVTFSSGTGSEVLNNIISDNTSFSTGLYCAGATVDYNNGYGHTWNYSTYDCSPGSGSLEVNPRFTDAASGDYTLDLGFSPCVDAGSPLSGYNDADGSRNDMGAYGGPGGAW